MDSMRRRIQRGALAALALVLTAGPAFGLGLRTRFGEVIIRKVHIGQTYSLYELLNLPMAVTNTSDETVDVRMTALIPKEKSLREGYEAIPSTGWARLDKQLHLGIRPGAEAVSDVIIEIPNDRSLLGKRYQVHYWSRIINRSGITAGMESILLINVATEELGERERLQKRVKKRLANVNFMLMPSHGKAFNVPLGEKLDLKERYGLSIKLVNPNDEKVTFRLVPKNSFEAAITAVKGFGMPPNPRFVSLEKEVLEVEANSIGEAKIFLEVPVSKHHWGKKWLFVISADLLEQEIPVHYNYRLLVSTVGKPEEKESEKKAGGKKAEEKKP